MKFERLMEIRRIAERIIENATTQGSDSAVFNFSAIVAIELLNEIDELNDQLYISYNDPSFYGED